MDPERGRTATVHSRQPGVEGTLLLRARELSLGQVVPLVQTFGHMEFVLKHGKFRHLREVLEYPNSLRPIAADNGELGGGVAELVKEMIRQVRSRIFTLIMTL